MKALFSHSMRALSMNGSQVLVGLLTSILLARALGPEGRGSYALAILLASVASMLANPGLYASANYFLSTQRWQASEAFGTIVLSSLLIGLLSGAVVTALVSASDIVPALTGQPGVALAIGILTM